MAISKPAAAVRILLTEGSSLTARETLTVLGPSGHVIDVLDPRRPCIARFSRYAARVHRAPAAGVDPLGYLEAAAAVIARRRIEVVLPTHEQAWLLAVARDRLPPVGLAVAPPAAFERVQSKLAFARLADELGLPQPAWREVVDPGELEDFPFPCYLKAAHSTAGRGVRLVRTPGELDAAFAALGGSGPLLAQASADGAYCQVQALFADGRLIAVHTSRRTGVGAGGSAAARESTLDRPAHDDAARLGEHLGWHGGLTLDYLDTARGRLYIECNPRTVEPGNAKAAGCDIPAVQLALSRGEAPPAAPVVGRAGVRTHGTLALLVGAAERTGRRRAVAAELARATSDRASTEVLTPLRDPPSLAALAVVAVRLLVSPGSASGLAAGAVDAYSVGPAAVARFGSA